MNRDKCPLRDTSQDRATRRGCISTREETRVSTSGLHNEWGTCHKLCYSIWPEHNFDNLCSENFVCLWLLRVGLTAVSCISELLTPISSRIWRSHWYISQPGSNQACLPFISFQLVRFLVQNAGTLPDMAMVSNMRTTNSLERCANEMCFKNQCWVGVWFFEKTTNSR